MDITNYDRKKVYRVWYNGKEAFFTDKGDAQAFAESVKGCCNIWNWEMYIEK